jgi:IS30 family transposase
VVFHDDEDHIGARQRALLPVWLCFATLHHAWERGTNENTNGLIRQYLPKGKSMAHITQADCDEIAAKLNSRPRKRLGFRTPEECYETR